MRKLLFCAGAAACISASAAELDPAELLVKSAEASRTSNYQGVVIYRGDDRFEVLRVQHRFKDDSERERMVSLTGEPRQLVRIDNRMIAILPKGKTLSVERPALKGFLSQLTGERVQQLKQYYEFRDEGVGRIAGRPCRGVAVAPRDGFRYGYEVWTDQESMLPLKISLIGERNEVLEQVMYTEVAFPESIPDSAFETEVDISKFNLITRTLPKLDAPAPQPEHGDRRAAGAVRDAAAGIQERRARRPADARRQRPGRTSAAVRRPVGGLGVQRRAAAGRKILQRGLAHGAGAGLWPQRRLVPYHHRRRSAGADHPHDRRQPARADSRHHVAGRSFRPRRRRPPRRSGAERKLNSRNPALKLAAPPSRMLNFCGATIAASIASRWS
ncbi:MAG: hypothetical protein NVS9B10_19270 [Nevskia sp.]